MKYYAILLLATVVISLVFAGCTQPSGTVPVTPAVPATPLSTPEPVTSVPTTAATRVPQQVVTVIHQVSLQKTLKDSELLFSLEVPVEWDVKTYRLGNAGGSEGLEFRTDLVRDDTFFLTTYTASRSQDQAYRDQFRQWSPAPAETTVTINGIIYDRFESTSDGITHVAYVARKGSANERGYASVLVFAADTTHRFEKEDFEKVVSSFKYFTAYSASTVSGEEIVHTDPPFTSTGSALSRSASGNTGSSGGSSSGGCSRCGTA